MLVVPKRVEVDGVVNALLQVIAAHATTERANADFMISANLGDRWIPIELGSIVNSRRYK